MKVLRRFPEYEEFRTRTRQRKGQPEPGAGAGSSAHDDLAPREAIAEVIDSAHAAVAADLLARVIKQPPVFLEQFVLSLLVKMGYGGLEAPAQHLGAPGDAGLNGLILPGAGAPPLEAPWTLRSRSDGQHQDRVDIAGAISSTTYVSYRAISSGPATTDW